MPRMICAICSATRPLTPVSISSNMMVGSPIALLIMALSDNITRAISPPEATCDTGSMSVLLLALNRNITLSTPFCASSPVVICTLNLTLGMPSGANSLASSPSTSTAALRRTSLSTAAFCVHSVFSASTRCLHSSNRSSLLSMLPSWVSSSFFLAISSSTVAT